MVKIKVHPEYKNVENFVQFCIDEEKTEFNHEDLTVLAYALRKNPHLVRLELESYGLKLAKREPTKVVRGFNTSSHDRWFGPGSCPTHGGCGIDSETGRATSRGTI